MVILIEVADWFRESPSSLLLHPSVLAYNLHQHLRRLGHLTPIGSVTRRTILLLAIIFSYFLLQLFVTFGGLVAYSVCHRIIFVILRFSFSLLFCIGTFGTSRRANGHIGVSPNRLGEYQVIFSSFFQLLVPCWLYSVHVLPLTVNT